MRGGHWKYFWITLFLLAYAVVLFKSAWHPETWHLPYYIAASLLRLVITYGICLIFGISIGIFAAMNKTAGEIIIPLLDILQSVPVLAVFPFAVLIVVPFFGIGLASVIVLFMSMAWSIIFGVIAGVKAIPQHMDDMAAIFNIRGWAYIKHIVLPSIYPPLIAGSMLAFGSGWYFIIASEYITYGSRTYTLPGLGYYLDVASFQYGDIWMSLAGLFTIALVVYCIHVFVWKRLDKNIREAKFLTLHFGYDRALDLPVEHTGRTEQHKRVHFNRRHAHQWFFNLFRFNPNVYLSILIIMLLVGFGIAWSSNTQILYTPVELFMLTLSSVSRIILAYLLAFIIAICAGYLLIRKPKTRNFIMPLADVLQSIPAIAYFPLFYLVLAATLQPWLGLHVASVLLLMTGMLWYLLFNIMEAVEHLPSNINDVAQLYELKGVPYVKNVLIPAMFPALITGSILAFGGGWNAIMVSEYVNIRGNVYSVPGLGQALNVATGAGNTATLLMILFIMTGTILILNHFVWRRLLNRASKYVLEEE
jgi:NitT/TauT family transport system permease protein